MPALLAAGKLDRTVRLLRHADALCPAERHRSFVPLVETLAELGAWPEVRSVAAAIDASRDAPADAKQAAQRARQRADEHEAASAGSGTEDAARALLGKALGALERGRTADTQRLVDRARWSLERAQGAQVSLEAENGLPGGAAAVDWSPDGRAFALAYRREVRVIDAVSLRERVRLAGHTDAVQSVAFSPDGETLATGAQDGSIRLWHVPSGREVRRFAFMGSRVAALAFTPDGKRLLSATDAVRVWDLSTGTLQWARHGLELSLSADGTWLVTLSGYAHAQVRDTATGAPLRRIMPEYAEGVVPWAPSVSEAWACSDNRRVLTTYSSASSWLAIRLWDAPTGRPLGGGRPVGLMRSPLDVTADCALMALHAPDHTLELYDVREVAQRRSLAGHGDDGGVVVGAFSPQADQLVTAGEDGIARLWDVGSGRELSRLGAHTPGAVAIAFGSAGAELYAVMADRSVRTWDLAAGALQRRKGPIDASVEPRRTALSADGRRIAWVQGDRSVHVWDLRQQRQLREIAVTQHSPRQIALSFDGAWLATTFSDNIVRLHEVASGATAWAVKLPYPNALAISPDGKLVAVASDGLKVLRAADGSKRAAAEWRGSAADRIVFSRQGDQLAAAWGTGLQTSVTFCRLGDDLVCEVTEKLPVDWAVGQAVAFAPDGKQAAVGLGKPDVDGKSVYLFEPSTGRRLHALGGHEVSVIAVVFSRDGRFVASMDRDGTVVVRDPSQPDRAATLRAVRDADAGYVLSGEGLFDLLGANADSSRRYLSCRIGAVALPLGLCEERFRVSGLLSRLLQGEREALDP